MEKEAFRAAAMTGKARRMPLTPWVWETATIRRRHVKINWELLHDAVWPG
ncbi:MAG TPA: hypothetical protein PK836_09875 [Syntrophales bacterium]|nr:hypothetical protein [Syntrophales bacterium]